MERPLKLRLQLRGWRHALHYTAPLYLALLALAASGWITAPRGAPTAAMTLTVLWTLAALAAWLQWWVLGFRRIQTPRDSARNRDRLEKLAWQQGWGPAEPTAPAELAWRVRGVRKDVLVSVRLHGQDVHANAVHQWGIATLGRGSAELRLIEEALRW